MAGRGGVAVWSGPTAFRAIKKEDPQGRHLARYHLANFRALFLAGERADPDTVKWAEDILKVPVIDHWWQTETGWAIAGNPIGLGQLPVKRGSPTVAMPGYDVRIVDEACREVAPNRMGSIVLKAGVNRPPGEIEKEIVALVREQIGPVAAFKLAITVARLPKTRSGKILRGTMKKIADGEPWTMPATIDDPAILGEIGSALKEHGVGG